MTYLLFRQDENHFTKIIVSTKDGFTASIKLCLTEDKEQKLLPECLWEAMAQRPSSGAAPSINLPSTPADKAVAQL